MTGVQTCALPILNEQSVYIDAQGRVSPCCWLGSRQKEFITDFEEIKNSWSSLQPNITCLNSCGTKDIGTNFTNQWQKNIELSQ